MVDPARSVGSTRGQKSHRLKLASVQPATQKLAKSVNTSAQPPEIQWLTPEDWVARLPNGPAVLAPP
jgi:hypothetical protein